MHRRARGCGSAPATPARRTLRRDPVSMLESPPTHRAAIADALAHVRERTLRLLAPLSDEQLSRQWTEIASPLVWDLAHIGHFEELWLVRTVGGQDAEDNRTDDVYD